MSPETGGLEGAQLQNAEDRRVDKEETGGQDFCTLGWLRVRVLLLFCSCFYRFKILTDFVAWTQQDQRGLRRRQERCRLRNRTLSRARYGVHTATGDGMTSFDDPPPARLNASLPEARNFHPTRSIHTFNRYTYLMPQAQPSKPGSSCTSSQVRVDVQLDWESAGLSTWLLAS